MADSPEVPDLKKALQNKPAGFSWTPGGTVAKAAASAAGVPGRAPTPRERLMALGPAKLALAAVAFLMIGGLAFSLASFGVAGPADGGSGSTLGGVASSMKIRFARQNDPTGYIRREKAAGNEKMRFDLIAGAPETAPGGAPGDGTGAAGGDADGGAPMNYDEGTGATAGTAGGAAGGGAAGAGKGGAPGGSGAFAGGAAPRLSASGSSVRFQGMKRISSTAGFRGIQGRRGTLNKSMGSGSSATPFGAGTGGGSAAGGTAASGGRDPGSAAAGPGRSAGDRASAGSSAAGGGGGGGGGIPGVDMDALQSTVDVPTQIQSLLTDAGKLRKDAEDEKKKAQILQAGAQTAQAAYHYDRYRKKKSAAEDKEAEAAKLTAGMEDAAGSIVEQPNAAP